MTWLIFWPTLIIILHSALLAALLGRFNSPAFAFIHSRGYSRDALWGHIMLVSLLSAFMACLPAGMLVWTGLRSYLYDLLGNPNFPIMGPLEMVVPVVWLCFYIVLIPIFHYVWTRLGQPTRGGLAGIAIVIAILFAFMEVADNMYLLNQCVLRLCEVMLVIIVVCLLLVGRKLHRLLEVRT